MPELVSILAIEDEDNHAELLHETLMAVHEHGVVFNHASNREDALAALAGDYQIIFLDYNLGPHNGLDILREMRAKDDLRPVIVLTGQGDEYVAVDMMRAGADDYIVKDDLGPDKVSAALEVAFEKIRLMSERDERVSAITDRLHRLTAREREIMDLVIEGKTTKEICSTLHRSESTIKIHRSRVMQKMEANTPADLARMVMSARNAESD